MAVYKRGYQRYSGPLTSRWHRLLVLPRYAWSGLLEQRIIVILLVLALFFPVGCIGYVYLVNNPLLLSLDTGTSNLLKIDSRFFLIFMNVQSVFAILLASFAGPSLIAPDLTNGALPLYFSRPLTRGEYIVARMLVLLGMLSPVTWMPGLLVFGMQVGLAGWSWFAANWHMGVAVVVGLLLWIVLVSLVAMASSAYVKWRVVAGALIQGIFFVLSGASSIINEILGVDWAGVLTPVFSMEQVWSYMLGADALTGPGPLACGISLAVMTGLLLAILNVRLRPVEVVK